MIPYNVIPAPNARLGCSESGLSGRPDFSTLIFVGWTSLWIRYREFPKLSDSVFSVVRILTVRVGCTTSVVRPSSTSGHLQSSAGYWHMFSHLRMSGACGVPFILKQTPGVILVPARATHDARRFSIGFYLTGQVNGQSVGLRIERQFGLAVDKEVRFDTKYMRIETRVAFVAVVKWLPTRRRLCKDDSNRQHSVVYGDAFQTYHVLVSILFYCIVWFCYFMLCMA